MRLHHILEYPNKYVQKSKNNDLTLFWAFFEPLISPYSFIHSQVELISFAVKELLFNLFVLAFYSGFFYDE